MEEVVFINCASVSTLARNYCIMESGVEFDVSCLLIEKMFFRFLKILQRN